MSQGGVYYLHGNRDVTWAQWSRALKPGLFTKAETPPPTGTGGSEKLLSGQGKLVFSSGSRQEKRDYVGRFQSPVGLVWMWRLNTVRMWKSQSEILETPWTSRRKNEIPSTAQESSQSPKDRKRKCQYKKKKKGDNEKSTKSLAKRTTKDCSSVQRNLKPEKNFL